MTQRGTKRAADKNLTHVTQHVIANSLRTGRVHIAVHNLQPVKRVHGKTKQCRENANLEHYPQNRRRGSFGDAWVLVTASRIESPHARAIPSCFYPAAPAHAA